MACPDFRYSKVYSNKTPNTAVFLPKTGIFIIETVPYSFSKVFQAFQPGSWCNLTGFIRWHVRIFDIPKMISIKPKILGFFYEKQGFPLLKRSHIRSARRCKRFREVPGEIRRDLSDGMVGFWIFPSVHCVARFSRHGRYMRKTQHCISAIDLFV